MKASDEKSGSSKPENSNSSLKYSKNELLTNDKNQSKKCEDVAKASNQVKHKSERCEKVWKWASARGGKEEKRGGKAPRERSVESGRKEKSTCEKSTAPVKSPGKRKASPRRDDPKSSKVVKGK